MKIRIEFDTDNESFQEEGFYTEVKKVLSDVGNKIESTGVLMEIDRPIYDSNGNKIGRVIKEDV